MKLTTTLLALSLMTNVLTASELATFSENGATSEKTSDSSKNESSLTQEISLMQKPEDVNAFIELLNMYSDSCADFKEALISSEDDMLQPDCNDMPRLEFNYVYNSYFYDEKKIENMLKFYNIILDIMFKSIKNKGISKKFKGNFDEDFMRFNFQEAVCGVYDGVKDVPNQKSSKLIDIEENKNNIESSELEKKVLEKEVSKFLRKILGENNQNSDNMQEIVKALFSEGDPKSSLVKLRHCVIDEVNKNDFNFFNGGTYVIKENKNEPFDLSVSVFSCKQNVPLVLIHELGHVLQEINYALKYNGKEREEDDCGEELISLYFELSYVLNGVDENVCYGILNKRWGQFWGEALQLKDYYKIYGTPEEDEYKKDPDKLDISLSFYGVSFVIAINRAVEFYKNKRSETDIINELLDLTNNNKLWLRNLDFSKFLDDESSLDGKFKLNLGKELKSFATSFGEYLKIIKENSEKKN